jgi:dihydroneopterin aldolase
MTAPRQDDGGVSSSLDEVTLRGMRFHALVGILPHERSLPQPLEIDVTAWIASGTIVDYRDVYEAARSVVLDEKLEYLEGIADAIARRTLALRGVARARVAVRKPHVALAGPLEHAEVAVVRSQRG